MLCNDYYQILQFQELSQDTKYWYHELALKIENTSSLMRFKIVN